MPIFEVCIFAPKCPGSIDSSNWKKPGDNIIPASGEIFSETLMKAKKQAAKMIGVVEPHERRRRYLGKLPVS